MAQRRVSRTKIATHFTEITAITTACLWRTSTLKIRTRAFSKHSSRQHVNGHAPTGECQRALSTKMHTKLTLARSQWTLRFIPQRPISGQLDLSTRFRLLQSSQTTSSCSTPPSTTITTTTTVTAPVTDADIRKANAARTYTSLLRTELFGNCDAEATSDIVSSDAPRTPRKCARVLSFTPTTPRTPKRALGSDDSSYAPHSPLSAGGRRILRRQLESPGAQRVRQRQREIGRVPIRILDAPKLTVRKRCARASMMCLRSCVAGRLLFSLAALEQSQPARRGAG